MSPKRRFSGGEDGLDFNRADITEYKKAFKGRRNACV